MLKLVADLTALALTHVTNLRATESAANVDGLTNVFNKMFFQKRLGDELHRAEQEQHPVSLLLIDIDHFKNYNDNNGHLAGDEVLRTLGKILRGSIREDDVAARYGGEEFVVLYPGVGKSDALRLAEGLRRAVEATAFPQGSRQPLGALTISGGVASFPEDARSGIELVRAADEALLTKTEFHEFSFIRDHSHYSRQRFLISVLAIIQFYPTECRINAQAGDQFFL